MRMPKILSVCWHSVEQDSADPTRYEGWNTTAALFREQVRTLVDRYTPISVRQFVDMANGRPSTLPKPPVLLTFDDGFKSVLEHALPILEEFRVPALFFVLGELIRNPDFVPWFIELS